MERLRKILVGTLLFVVLLIVVSFFLPSKVKVVRSLKIDAPVEVIFPKVNELGNWEEWSPWKELDPEMKISYGELKSGEGAGYCWVSKLKTAGKGCLSIVESVSNETIVLFFDFTQAGRGTAKGHWLFEPFVKDQEDSSFTNGVFITWSMETDVNSPAIIGKYLGLFLEDKVGPLAERGLLNLKKVTEEELKARAEDGIRLIELPVQKVLSIRDSCSTDAVGDKLRELYTELAVFMSLKDLENGGPPLTIYHLWEPENNKAIIEAAIPVLLGDVATTGRVRLRDMPVGKAVTATHYGPFSESDATHHRLEKWIEQREKRLNGAPWEVYVTDPTVERDTAKWETRIYYPVSGN